MRFIVILSILLFSFRGPDHNIPEELRQKGIEFKSKGAFDSALYYYQQARHYFIQNKDSIGLANVLSNIASIEGIKGNFLQSFELYQSATSIYESMNYADGIIKSNVNIANQYMKSNSFHNAVEYYLKAEKSAKDIGEVIYSGYIYNGLGNVFSNKNFEQRDLYRAKNYYREALITFGEKKDLKNVAKVHNNLAIIYEELGQVELAVNSYNQYVRYGKENNDPSIRLKGFHNLGTLFQKNEKYQLAFENFRKAEELAIQISDPVSYIHILSNLVDVCMNLGDVDLAKNYLGKYKLLKDSIYNNEKSEALSDLQVKYKTKEKEELLLRETELSDERRLRNIILSILLFLLIVSIVVIVIINGKRRGQELKRFKSEREVESLRAKIEGVNNERKRVASDLHDSVGGLITSVRMIHSGYLEKGGESALKVDHLLGEASNTVREVSQNLSSATLERYGLKKSVEQSISSFAGDMDIQFISNIEREELPLEVCKSVDFIVKELLNNTIKHAHAKSVAIQLNIRNSLLIFTYEDDGIGFDLNSSNNGLGLTSIRDRVALIEGSITLDSSPHEGFVCGIEAPVKFLDN